MIIGVGTDLVDIRRIEQAIARFGERFLCRLFTTEERQRAGRVGPAKRAASYAKRFAVKEACAKALGTGFRGGIIWHDFGTTVIGTSGRPAMCLTGQAARRLADITPARMVAWIDVTVSDEYPFAQAFVVISAVPIWETARNQLLRPSEMR
ncbi:Holo-[acyl-carrier protein] synthase [invertebrate metagenome]|uniref:Holo-[acyl-carrier protein] synthase n=1 Tax=invertebrate metagenome TaxID=1711999 RepID=A0A484H4J5_9ZZZZ